jgi:hypothetical protein
MDTPKRRPQKKRLTPRGSPPEVQKIAPKELDLEGNKIKHLPGKTGAKELTTSQLKFDLGIHVQAEPDGIGMGVLTDGTPFLTGRGLARLVDMENLHIRTIGMDWNDDPPKPRIQGIKT